jgi:phage portal protein BeeE
MFRTPWLSSRGARSRAPEIKDSRAGPLIALTGAGRPRWTPRDYASLASEGFGKNPVVYRCVRMIAEAAASTPLTVFQDGVRADWHPLAKLLAQPNPEQAGAEWLEGVYGALQTAGNAYVEAVGDEAPEELWSLRPDRVKVIPGRGGWAQGYEYSVDGRSVTIGRAGDGWMPVMHLKLFHPNDDHYGFSPLEAAAFAIDVHNASGAWNKALLDNAARPSGAGLWVQGGRAADGGTVRGAEGGAVDDAFGDAERRATDLAGRRPGLEADVDDPGGDGLHRREACGGARDRPGVRGAAAAAGDTG